MSECLSDDLGETVTAHLRRTGWCVIDREEITDAIRAVIAQLDDVIDRSGINAAIRELEELLDTLDIR